MNPSKWSSIINGSASIMGGIAEKINKFVKISKKDDEINEVLFYGADDDKEKEKVGLNNLFCIYYIIIHASQTIDICVPTLNSDTISKCLINVHRKNLVKVRIVVHDSDDLRRWNEFLDVGIEVKVIEPHVKLEHDFLVIDAEYRDAVAVIGSIDYEIMHVNCKRDKTLLTSETALIKALRTEFERIWSTVENVSITSKNDLN